MWYKIAQQFENITKSRSPSSLSGNQQGISVNFQDYQQLFLNLIQQLVKK